MLMLDLAVKTNPIHLFSIIMKLHVFWTLGQNKNQKFNPFVFSSFKVWQSTWSTQSYVHININSKMLLFPDPSYAFFLQYVCQLFSVRSIWMKAIYCFDTWNTSYILYSIKIYSEFYQRNSRVLKITQYCARLLKFHAVTIPISFSIFNTCSFI